MENKIKIYGSCKGRGCRIINLPYDSRINSIHSEMFSNRYDISQILSMVELPVDKMVAKKR
jgi:hypothetical protein